MLDIQAKILEQKKKKNAIILAHNYQRKEVQDIADYCGDSFALAKLAAESSADIIVFCGVDFMAESALILSPDKIVLHPDKNATCPMAEMVTVEELKELKKDYPKACTVAYINTTAEVKTEVDICCTSSNVIKIINKQKEKDVIFIPDKNLGLYAKRFLLKKNLILWQGFCPTHVAIEKKDILELKNLHPNAEVLVHPECLPEVIDVADYVYSTEGMVIHAKKSKCKEFIIGTEKGLVHRLKKETRKTFYPLEKAICPNMKKITLAKVLYSLIKLEPRVELSKEVIENAKKPLERMIRN